MFPRYGVLATRSRRLRLGQLKGLSIAPRFCSVTAKPVESQPTRLRPVARIAHELRNMRNDPWQVAYHCGTFLSLAGMCMTDMMYLRLLSLFGGCCSIAFYMTRRPAIWGAVFWGGLFGAANAFMLIRLIYERAASLQLAERDAEIYEKYFDQSGVTLRQFLKLLAEAERVTAMPGDNIRQAGFSCSNLLLLTSGELMVSWNEPTPAGAKHAEEKAMLDGGWVGEMGFLHRVDRHDGQKRQPPCQCATEVVAHSECELLVWSDAVLHKLLDADRELQKAVLLELANTARQRLDNRCEDTEYQVSLKAVLIDGRLDMEERRFIDTLRLKLNISPSKHEWYLRQLGWTMADWGHGVQAHTVITDVQRQLHHTQSKNTRSHVFFNGYSHAFGELATYFPACFWDEHGMVWMSVEHYYQAHKFVNTADQDEIRLAPSPLEAHEIGVARRQNRPMCNGWWEVREEVMLRAIRCKFTQNAHCRQVLLSTGDRPLVLNDPHDEFWGNGDDGNGKNRLGFMLEQLRIELATQKHDSGGSPVDSSGAVAVDTVEEPLASYSMDRSFSTIQHINRYTSVPGLQEAELTALAEGKA